MNIKASDFPNQPGTRVFKWVSGDSTKSRFLVTRGRLALWSTPHEQKRVLSSLSQIYENKRVVHIAKGEEEGHYQVRFRGENGEEVQQCSAQGLGRGNPYLIGRIEEVTLRTFRCKEQLSAIVAGLCYLGSLLASPFYALYRAVAGTTHGEFVQSLHGDGAGHTEAKTILPQLKFVAKMFRDADSTDYGAPNARSRTQRMGDALESGYEMGCLMQKAKSESQREICKQKVLKRVNQGLESGEPVIVPVGRGEGDKFAQHFLLLNREEGRGTIEVKDVSFGLPKVKGAKSFAVKSYQIRDGDEQKGALVTALMALDATEPKDTNIRPADIKVDDQIERLLNELRIEGSAVTVQKHSSPSQDPVKLLYTVIDSIEEQVRDGDNDNVENDPYNPHALAGMIESKRAFYKAYIEELVRFYEAESGSLSDKEKAHVLRTLETLIDRIEEQLGSEVVEQGVAIESVRALKKQVQDRLSKFAKSTEEDAKIKANLKKQAQPFATRLDGKIESGGEVAKGRTVELSFKRGVGGVAVTGEQFQKVANIEGGFALQARDQVGALSEVLDEVEKFLQNKDADSAYALVFRLLQSLPPAHQQSGDAHLYWMSLEMQSLRDWIGALDRLSNLCLESASRTGAMPLPPREATEFHCKLPILMRVLYRRMLDGGQDNIDFDQGYIDHVNALLGGYQHAPIQELGLAQRTHRREEIIDKVRKAYDQHKTDIKREKQEAVRLQKEAKKKADDAQSAHEQFAAEVRKLELCAANQQADRHGIGSAADEMRWVAALNGWFIGVHRDRRLQNQNAEDILKLLGVYDNNNVWAGRELRDGATRLLRAKRNLVEAEEALASLNSGLANARQKRDEANQCLRRVHLRDGPHYAQWRANERARLNTLVDQCNREIGRIEQELQRNRGRERIAQRRQELEAAQAAFDAIAVGPGDFPHLKPEKLKERSTALKKGGRNANEAQISDKIAEAHRRYRVLLARPNRGGGAFDDQDYRNAEMTLANFLDEIWGAVLVQNRVAAQRQEHFRAEEQRQQERIVALDAELEILNQRRKRHEALTLGDVIPNDAYQRRLDEAQPHRQEGPRYAQNGEPTQDGLLSWLERNVTGRPQNGPLPHREINADRTRDWIRNTLLAMPNYLLGEVINGGREINIDAGALNEEGKGRAFSAIGAYARLLGFDKEKLALLLAKKQGVGATMSTPFERELLQRFGDFTQTTGEDYGWDASLRGSMYAYRGLQDALTEHLEQINVVRDVNGERRLNLQNHITLDWMSRIQFDRLTYFERGLRRADRNGLGWGYTSRRRDNEERSAIEDVEKQHKDAQLGYSDERGAAEGYALNEFTVLRRQLLAMQILHKPDGVLKQAGGVGAWVRGALRGDGADTIRDSFSGARGRVRFELTERREYKFGPNYECKRNVYVVGGDYPRPQTVDHEEYLGTEREAVEAGVRHLGGGPLRRTHTLDTERELLTADIKVPGVADEGRRFLATQTAIYRDRYPGHPRSKEEHAFSELSVREAFHFIYQNPRRVAQNQQLANLFYNRIFQHGLIRKMLLEDPDSENFFGQLAADLRGGMRFDIEMAEGLSDDGEGGPTTYLFLRFVLDRVRYQAIKIREELINEVPNDPRIERLQRVIKTLPPVENVRVIGTFNDESDCKKKAALYVLAHYCDGFEFQEAGSLIAYQEDNLLGGIEHWQHVFEAAYYLKKSTESGVHPALERRYLRLYGERLIPFLQRQLEPVEGDDEAVIHQKSVRRSEFFRRWCGLANVEVVAPYLYKGTKVSDEGKSESLKINLQTCEGMPFDLTVSHRERFTSELRELLNGSECHLYETPEYVEKIEDNRDPERGVTVEVYEWKSEYAHNTRFQMEVTSSDWADETSVRIYQAINKKRYLYMPMPVSTSSMSKVLSLFSNSGNYTLEKMLDYKGVWVEVDRKGVPDTTRIFLAQERQDLNLNKEPIHLIVQGDKVRSATVGRGSDKRVICSGLKDSKVDLLPFCDANGLLYMSHNGKSVTEIKFPSEPDETPLVLTLGKSGAWHVKGQERWEWEQEGHEELEGRFGKDYRSFVLPLYCKATGERMWYVFPYPIGKGGKMGDPPRLLRTPKDLLEESGVMIDQLVGMAGVGDQLPQGFGVQDITAMVATGVQAAGGMTGIQDMLRRTNAVGDQTQQLMNILSAVHSPAPFVMREGSGGHSSSHAGFFYLAMKAAASKDYRQAAYYLDKMKSVEAQTETIADFEQMEQMLVRFVAMMIVKREVPRTGSEAAFMLRSFATVMHVTDALSSRFGRDLLSLSFAELPLDALGQNAPQLPESLNLRSAIRLVSQLLYGKYQRSLQDSKNRTKLEGRGLVLSKIEERSLCPNPILTAAAYGKDMIERVVQGVTDQFGGGGDLLAQIVRDFMGVHVADVAAPAVDDIPSESEAMHLFGELVKLRDSQEFASVEDLHKARGASPKRETVLSNFWLYWEWIYKTDVKREDLTFLREHISDKEPHAKEVNIARRLLLLHFEEKGPRARRVQNVKDDIARVKERWCQLPDNGQRERAMAYFDRAFLQDPTLWRLALSKGYRGYVYGRNQFHERIANPFDWAAARHFIPRNFDGQNPERGDLVPNEEQFGGVTAPRQTAEQKMRDFWTEVVIRPLYHLHNGFERKFSQLSTAPQLQQDERHVVPTYRKPEVDKPGRSERDRARERRAEDAVYAARAAIRRFLEPLAGVMGEGLGVAAILESEELNDVFSCMCQSYIDAPNQEIADQEIGSLMALVLSSDMARMVMHQLTRFVEVVEDPVKAYPEINELSGQFFQAIVTQMVLGQDPIQAVIHHLGWEQDDPMKHLALGLFLAKRFNQVGLIEQLLPEQLRPYSELVLSGNIAGVFRRLSPAGYGDYMVEMVEGIRNDDQYKIGTEMGRVLTHTLRCEGLAGQPVNPPYVAEEASRREIKTGEFGCNPRIIRDETPDSIDLEVCFRERDTWTAQLGDKVAKALGYVNLKKNAPGEESYLTSIENGMVTARNTILERTKWSFKKDRLRSIAKEVETRAYKTHKEKEEARRRVLNFVRLYQEPLRMTYLFAGKKRVDEDLIMRQILAYYELGQLNCFGQLQIEEEITADITRYLYASTELMQLKKSADVLYRMGQMEKASKKGDDLEESIEWCGLSQQLFESLRGGTDRRRYMAEDGTFEDAALGRSYLLFDYKTGYVTRGAAREVVEEIIADERSPEIQKKLHILRMGLGKTTFISPLIAAELVNRGKKPICMTTGVLVRQLMDNLGPRAHFFEFDLNYGRGSFTTMKHQRRFHEHSCGVDPSLTKEDFEAHLLDCPRGRFLENDHSRIEQHLDSIYATLQQLQGEKRYVVTTPEQIAMLRNQRVILQNEISEMEPSEDRTKLFSILNKLKRIEGYFYGEDIVFIPDEDVNRAIEIEINVARGKSQRLNKIRFDVAEKIFLTILDSDASTTDPALRERRELAAKLASNICEGKFGQDERDLMNRVNGLYVGSSATKSLAEVAQERKRVEELLEAFRTYDQDQNRENWLQLQEAAKAVKQEAEDRAGLKGLRELLVSNDLRPITNFKEALRPLAEKLVRDTHYWKDVWRIEDWPQDEDSQDEMINYLLGIRETLPWGMRGWEAYRDEKEQEGLSALASLRTYLIQTFETVAGVNPHLSRGIRSADGVTPVPYEDGLEKDNMLYATETEYIMHAMLLYLRGDIDIREQKFEDFLAEMKTDDRRVSPNHTVTWKEISSCIRKKTNQARVDGQKMHRPYPVITGLGPRSKQDYLDRRPEEKRQLRQYAMRERLYLLRAFNNRGEIPIFHEQVRCNTQETSEGRGAIHLLSGTGCPFTLGLLRADGFNPNDLEDHIAAETILSFKDLDEAVTTFDGNPVKYIESLLSDMDCKAVLNQDYTTEPAQSKELVEMLRQTEAGKKRQFIYRDSVTREKMIWNPESANPVPYSKDGIRRESSFFVYMPPDRRGVDFAVPKGERFYAVAMVGVGVDADTHDQLVWRMRQFGTGQQVRFAIDHKTSTHIQEFLDRGDSDEELLLKDNDEIKTGHVLRYVQHCTVKSRRLNRIKRACSEAEKPLRVAVQEALRESSNIFDPQSDRISQISLAAALLGDMNVAPTNPHPEAFPLLEGFEAVLFKPHRDMMIQTHVNNWEEELGQQTEVPREEFIRGLITASTTKVEQKRAAFVEGVNRYLDDHVANERDRARVINAIFNGDNERFSVRLPNPGLDTEAYLHEYKEALAYAISLNEIIDKSRLLLKGYNEARATLLDCWNELDNRREYYKAFLPNQIRRSSGEGTNVEQRQQQQQQMQQMQQMQQQVNMLQEQQQRQKAHRNPPMDRNTDPLTGFLNGIGNSLSVYQAPGGWFNRGPTPYPNDRISDRAKLLLDRASSFGNPIVHLLVVKDRPGQFRSCLITAAEWEQSLKQEMVENPDVEASIYAITPYAFRTYSHTVMGSTENPLSVEDELNPEFLRLQIRTKIFLDIPNFTPVEWDFIKAHLNEFQNEYPHRGAGQFSNYTVSECRQLFDKMQSNTEDALKEEKDVLFRVNTAYESVRVDEFVDKYYVEHVQHVAEQLDALPPGSAVRRIFMAKQAQLLLQRFLQLAYGHPNWKIYENVADYRATLEARQSVRHALLQQMYAQRNANFQRYNVELYNAMVTRLELTLDVLNTQDW